MYCSTEVGVKSTSVVRFFWVGGGWDRGVWVENALGAAGRGVTGAEREISCRYPSGELWPSYEDIYDNECKTLGVCTISVDDTRNNRYNFIIGRPRWLYTHEAQTNHLRYLISPLFGG